MWYGTSSIDMEEMNKPKRAGKKKRIWRKTDVNTEAILLCHRLEHEDFRENHEVETALETCGQ